MKLKNLLLKKIKHIFFSAFIVTTFSGCFYTGYTNFDGSNDFEELVDDMIKSSYSKIKDNLEKDDVVFVSDFVNVDKLQNHSKLGFLLSEVLKNVLSNNNIIAREVELGKDFKIGDNGFNVLSRDTSRINTYVEKGENFALVGTYSITNKRFWVFIKLIDIYTGHILASSSSSIALTSEIILLEEKEETKKESNQYNIFTPLVL